LVCIAHSDTRLTSSGMILGTPGFLAPEQASGGTIGERTDLFSLGVVLFLLATGRLPIQGKDPLALLRALAVEEPPAVSELNSAVPQALSDLIRSLLAKEPDARPASAREVIDALAAIETNRAPSENIPVQGESGAPVVPRRRIAWWVVLGSLGMAGALGLWLLLSSFGIRKEKGSPGASIPAVSGPKLAAAPGGEVWKLAFSDPLRAAVFCPDGKHILCGGDDRTVRLLETASGREVKRFDAFSAPVLSLAVAGEGGVFVTGGGYYVSGPNHTGIPKECRVQVWDLAEGKERARFEGHREPVHSVAISADGQSVLSACGHDHVRLWDVPGQRQQGQFGDSNGSAAVAMTPDGKRGLYLHGREICLLDLDRGEEVRRFAGMTARGSVLCLRFAGDGEHAISGCAHWALEKDTFTPLECVLRLWDLQGGKELKRFEGHGAHVRACTCSRDGRFFLSGSGTGVHVAGGVRRFDCSVRLWDAASGKELKRFEGHDAPVRAVDISPDGRFGLSVGDDRTLRLWNFSSFREDN
jgi:WD40 repeat protein